MRQYEIMLILPAEADESVITGVAERITKVVSEHAGEVAGIDRWGRRRFAYEIARQGEGYYVVVGVKADPTTMDELDRVLTLADEVIRFKVIVRGEAA